MRKSLAAFVLGFWLFVPLIAEAATIYFAGDVPSDFSPLSGSGWTTGGAYDPTFTSGNLEVSLGKTGWPPNGQTLLTPTFTPISSLWLHFFFGAATTSTQYQGELVGFYGSDGVMRLAIQGSGANNTLQIATRDSSGTFTNLVSCAMPFSLAGGYPFDVNVVYSTTGSITLYQNGVLACSYSGNITTNGTTALNQVEWNAPYGASTRGYVSQVIVSDSPTIGRHLLEMLPQAAGTTQQWSGATVGNISKAPPNDSTFNSTATANQISDWTVPALPTGTWVVEGVKQVARVNIGGSGPQHFAFTCRPNGQNDTASATQSPTTSFAPYAVYWSTNCATGAPWAPADFTGANFGIESLP